MAILNLTENESRTPWGPKLAPPGHSRLKMRAGSNVITSSIWILRTVVMQYTKWDKNRIWAFGQLAGGGRTQQRLGRLVANGLAHC